MTFYSFFVIFFYNRLKNSFHIINRTSIKFFQNSNVLHLSLIKITPQSASTALDMRQKAKGVTEVDIIASYSG